MNETQNKTIWSYYPVTVLAAIFCCVLWGSASPAIKIAYRLFGIGPEDTGSRIMLSGARFTLAGIMTISFGSLICRRPLLPKRQSLPLIAVLSCVQTVGQYYFFFMSLANTTGVRGTLINAAGNFLAILIAAYIFHLEEMTVRKLIGCAVGFSGLLIILSGGASLIEGAFTFAGEGAMLLAALFYGFSGCLIKIFSRREDPVVLSGWQFLFGGILLFIIGYALGGRLHFTGAACWGNLIYMAFISAGAYTIWGILLTYNPVSRVSILGFINPVMGVLLSALFLGENSEAFSLVGVGALLLVSLGIIIVNSGKQ